jgi:spore coat polysaccharide biosynthesis protein SpsF (cytidylyltransferase family)
MESSKQMNSVAIIQARTSSSRLPGKVLKSIGGDPMIVFMLRRVALASKLDRVVVATSVEKSDDHLAEVVLEHGYDCFRGDLSDVLGRYANAAHKFNADVVVRLTADCPLMDAELIDRAIITLNTGNFDYVSNVDPPTFPDGLDVEAMTGDALRKMHEFAKDASDREHVTPYIRRNKSIFRQANFQSSIDLSALRWTVDHDDDLNFVNALVNSLRNRNALGADRFDFLRAMAGLEAGVPRSLRHRNEKYLGPAEPARSDIESEGASDE